MPATRLSIPATVEVAELEWGEAGWHDFAARAAAFCPTLVLGADLCYTDAGGVALALTAQRLLQLPGCSLLLVAYKERGAGGAFFSALRERGLRCEDAEREGEHRVLRITAAAASVLEG